MVFYNVPAVASRIHVDYQYQAVYPLPISTVSPNGLPQYEHILYEPRKRQPQPLQSRPIPPRELRLQLRLLQPDDPVVGAQFPVPKPTLQIVEHHSVLKRY